MVDKRSGFDAIVDLLVEDILEMSDEEILAEAKEDGDCLDCGGWGRFWTINRDGQFGPLYPSSLPCPACGGTGKSAPPTIGPEKGGEDA